MATYKDIQNWIKENYGFVVKTCWIAHVKEICGLPVGTVPNRRNKTKRINPCPPNKVIPITQALKFLGMI